MDGTALVGLVTTQDILATLVELLEPERPTGFDHILLALDFGASTPAAVTTGVRLARQHDARLTLLHVLPPPSRALVAEGVPREVLDWARRQQREECLARLAALVPAEPGLEVGRLVVTGDLSTVIVATAARLSADLIVLGRRPRHRLLGPSLTDVLVAHAPCPVLVVRPDVPNGVEACAAHAGA